MARLFLISFLFVFNMLSVHAQPDPVHALCRCPVNSFTGVRPDTTFKLANGQHVVVCGWRDDAFPGTFSEFVVAFCGQDSIAGFWGATQYCRLGTDKSTVMVYAYKNLPSGANFKYEQTLWTTEKLSLRGAKVTRVPVLNRNIRKYDQKKISAALKHYEMAERVINDKTMGIAHQLFMATISGSQVARAHFLKFEKTFGMLDGAFAEEYKDLRAMLKLWDKK